MILSAQKAERKVVEQCYYCNSKKDVSPRRLDVIKHAIGCPEVCRGAKVTWKKGFDEGERNKASSSTDPTYKMGFEKGRLQRLREDVENYHDPRFEVDDPRDASLDAATQDFNRGERWGYSDQRLEDFWGKVTPDFARGYRVGKQRVDQECDNAAQSYYSYE